MAAAYENVQTETKGRVGIIRLNRPKALNALCADLVRELGLALDAFEADPGIGCIVLTGSAKEKPQTAEVVAVGPGGLVDGKEVKMTVKVGDKVIFSKYSGTEVKVDGVEYVIVRQSDLLATVE